MKERILLSDLINQISACMLNELKLSPRTVYGQSYRYMNAIHGYCLNQGEKYYNPVLLGRFLEELEARTLKPENVYLDSGEVLITGTKRNKNRIVVMSEDMRTLCVDYNERYTWFPFESDHFFPRANWEVFASTTILREFQRCWKNANPDISKENLPSIRVYDLCHRFAAVTVQHWLDDGSDLNAKLPFLRAYMGHDSFAQTAYYVHLQPANMTQNTAVDWTVFDTLIPEV